MVSTGKRGYGDLRTVRDVSAGGVITRFAGDTVEVVLVGRARPERWSIPKGTPIAGETLEDTALREVREETGLSVRILERLGDITYWFSARGVRHHKTVHFYLLEEMGGRIDDHDWENDFVEWVTADEAIRRMSFASEIGIVEKAIEQVLARHGRQRSGVSTSLPHGDASGGLHREG